MSNLCERLKGKVAVLTGVSPNILGAIAERFAQEGARVAALSLREDFAFGCATYLQKLGHEAMGLVCDVTREETVQSCAASVIRKWGRVDILVNGAATQIQKSLLETNLSEWSKQLDVILTGAFVCTKIFASEMVKRGIRGSIINIVSTEGHQGVPDNIAYATAKGALLHFTRCAAMDLARYGIRVNSLTPTATDETEAVERAARWGVVWEGALAKAKAPSRLPPEAKAKLIPLGRLPRPSDYAGAAVFLASDEASMITGVDLRVDGGAASKYWQWLPHASTT
ncbi:SDR family NAD(P)-dependent oxidoreductase [Thermus thermophilus]|uniref:Short-chain alcohol dehydrogenase like protein n=1 Tax=Thermus thermophilus JL-18 TaxID=798128 RepID=H9ZVA2_THETH|nr:SDR family oxidoreductase [Thermus thermophilus]AFH40262.1 dehydrogenase of unknown specificity, short-chain alcohol dehydrogenase like protein [Thermus thermophilus JL-18]